MSEVDILVFGGIAVYGLIRWARFGGTPVALVKSLLNATTPLEVRSAFSISETERRIGNIVGTTFFTRWCSGTVAGTVRDRSVRIGVRRVFWVNSLAPVLQARIFPRDDETWIKGDFGLDSGARFFMKVWFGFLGIISAIAIPAGLISMFAGDLEDAVFVLGPFGMFGMGLAAYDIATYFSRNDTETITDALSQAIGGTTRNLPG